MAAGVRRPAANHSRVDIDTSSPWGRAAVTFAVGLAALWIVRMLARRAIARYERRVLARRPLDQTAGLHTRLLVLTRVGLAILGLILAWQVLSIFPATSSLAQALLASSAVIAIVFGLAFSVPLGNLGAGVLLAFSQPARLGDRIEIEGSIGRVDEITLSYTVLVSDEGHSVMVPNSRMVNAVLINRAPAGAPRNFSVTLPLALDAPIERAREAVLAAAAGSASWPDLTASVSLGDVDDRVAWLGLNVEAPATTAVAPLAADLRERALGALAAAGLLPRDAPAQ
jgi:small-conductance mechanosensitive channel